MKSNIWKIRLFTLPILVIFLFSLCSDLFAGSGGTHFSSLAKFRKANSKIKKIPYNPRPIYSNTEEVTGISEDNSLSDFLSNFERVEFSAPRNGKTYASSNSYNDPDITLVGYMRIQKDANNNPLADRPGIILTHGGYGGSTIATHGGFLIHIANVLFEVGYHVLAFDRRDGLLTRCAYQGDPPKPNGGRSQESHVGHPPEEFCQNLPYEFRNTTFDPNSIVSGYAIFGAGDILAAAQYLKTETGTDSIGALSGSRGGLALIRAAAIQADHDNDFAPDCLDAILVLSPVADDNTIAYICPNSVGCARPKAIKEYSQIPGTGIRDFTDPEGAMEDWFALGNGVEIVKDAEIPVLIICTLTDDQTRTHGVLAYEAKTRWMPLAHTLIMARLGHFHEIWRSDPFWANKMVLTYFKTLLAKNISEIGDDPGFESLGPNTDNPLIVNLRFKKKEAEKFLSDRSMVPYYMEACIPLP